MPSSTLRRTRFAVLLGAGLAASAGLGGAPLRPQPPAQEVVWLDLDQPRDSTPAAPIIRNDGSAVPAGADLSLSLRDGKLILGGPSGPVALQDSSGKPVELTGESTCVGFTVGEPGSPEARQGWLLVSRDAATGLVTVHDWSCQTSPGAPLRPRPDGNVSAPAGHPLSRDRQLSETQKAYSELQGAYDPYRASFPAITGQVSTVPGLGTSSGSTLSLGGSQNQLGGTISGTTSVNGAYTSAGISKEGTFAGLISSGSLTLSGSNTYSGGSTVIAGTTTSSGLVTGFGGTLTLGNPTLSPGNLNLGNLGTGLAGGSLGSGGTTLAGGAASPGSWTVVNAGVVAGSTILTGGFSSSGSWSVSNAGSNVLLTWTPVPEPSTYSAVFALASLAFALRRRVR